MKHKLTDKYLSSFKPHPNRRVEIRDELLTGFSVRVSSSGKKTFNLTRRVNGKIRRFRLGDYGIMSLAEARERARQMLYEIETGEFERSTGVTVKRSPTLGQVLPEYLEKHAKVHNKDWRRKAAHLQKFRPLFQAQLNGISRQDLVTIIDEIAVSAPIGANRALAHIRHLFNWCLDRGLIDISPAARIKAPAKETARERTLSDDELVAVWASCVEEGYPFGTCTRLLILSGQRRAEVAEMRWSEIDVARQTWALPSARSKNGHQHEVPLTDEMVRILRSVPRFLNSDYVFTSNGKTPISGFGRFKRRLDASLPDITQPWIIHDLRRTFSTNLAMLGVPQPVTEALLNHQSGVVSGVAAIYNRHKYSDEKRTALEAWCERVRRIRQRCVVPARDQESCSTYTSKTCDQPRRRPFP